MTPFLRPACLIALVSILGACAETTAPLPPAEEVLLVVNSTEATLRVVPVAAPAAAVTLPLGGTAPTPVGVSARGGTALVPLGADNAVAVISLASLGVRIIPLPAGGGATGSAIVNDTLAYVANPLLNTVTRINLQSGDTASVAVGVYPQAIIATRGRVFVLNGNLVNFAPAGPSWVTVIDPVTNQHATGIDSIPLPGPGNAGFAAEGTDGLLYVVSSGDYFTGVGRLSIVDPVARTEVASFGGFGTGPGAIAVGADDRLFISSFTEGLMEFDTRTRTVVRGAGNGVDIPGNADVSVDSQGRIYAISTGPCQAGQPGEAHVLRDDLTESGTITLGECAFGSTVTSIPPVQ